MRLLDVKLLHVASDREVFPMSSSEAIQHRDVLYTMFQSRLRVLMRRDKLPGPGLQSIFA